MSRMLSRETCAGLFDRVQRAAKARGVTDVEAWIASGEESLTRFANNTIHQNVSESSCHLSVRAAEGGRTARATTNRLDDEAIGAVVEGAIELTRASEPDPELLPLAEPAAYGEIDRFSPSTAEATPDERAVAVAEAVRIAEEKGQTAAGIFSTEYSVQAILNSRGVFGWHAETLAVFSITALAEDSSGWAKASAADHRSLDPAALARRAVDKALASRNPREVPPGRYTVILEPAAALDLAGQMFGDFGATALADQRSFLTGRLGTRLFGENIHITDDVFHPLQAGPPFDGEGVPRRRLRLVEAGVPREVASSRASARRAGGEPTGHGFPLPNEYGEAPLNIVIAGGDASLDSLIASTSKGILVTRLWYIREVDPYEKIMTGMTRDGTFLIEDGRVVGGLRNFRFNQGLVELLGNVEALGPAERASGEETFDMVVPAMKVHGFHFTELTRF